jgi:hypothetical protein
MFCGALGRQRQRCHAPLEVVNLVLQVVDLVVEALYLLLGRLHLKRRARHASSAGEARKGRSVCARDRARASVRAYLRLGVVQRHLRRGQVGFVSGLEVIDLLL